MSQPLYIKIKDQDNVAIAVKDIKAGTEVMDGVIAHQDIPQAHKIALCDIEKGGAIIRYGVVLGYAVDGIKKGDWINDQIPYHPRRRMWMIWKVTPIHGEARQAPGTSWASAPRSSA